MKSAAVIGTGTVTIPNTDGRRALQIITNLPWRVGGEVAMTTGIYAEPAAIPFAPKTDDIIEWDHGHIWIAGRKWEKLDNEFNPDAPLH